jgi:dUTP pyrophosphatase
MLQIKLLNPLAIMPSYGSHGAAGLDLHTTKDVVINTGERALIPTGIAMAIPQGSVGLLWPRSKLSNKHGTDVLAGVIDSDYRGEIHVIIYNTGHESIRFVRGDAIAQMLIQEVQKHAHVRVDELLESARGERGILCHDPRTRNGN